MPGGAPPRLLPLAPDIALVVADVPKETYNASAIEAKLTDLDWVARSGAAHHAVVDRFAKSHVVVPLRLFTLFSSEAKALATLRRSHARLNAALDRVAGRQEWVLRIGTPDPSRGAADVPPRGASAESSGTSFLRAKANARRSEAERGARVLEDATALFDTLAGMADESRAHAVQAGTGLILDAAFLIPARRTAGFKKALTRAAAGLLRDGCRVSLTGPWPPYSFVDLDASPPARRTPAATTTPRVKRTTRARRTDHA